MNEKHKETIMVAICVLCSQMEGKIFSIQNNKIYGYFWDYFKSL